MIQGGKKNVLGVLVDAVDYDAAVLRIVSAAKGSQHLTVSALAVHGVMSGVLDARHRHRLNNLDLVVPDGQPVRWALNWLNRTNLQDRVYGPNLMLKVCEAAAREHLPIYLYGSTPAVLTSLSHRLTERMPELSIAGSQSSLFRRLSVEDRDEMTARVRRSGAKIAFVGLGCPRQEIWLYENSRFLPLPLVAVGAAFEFIAGTSPQAPISLQKVGLEWAFRLAHEPRRLWKRYLLLNPLYVILLLSQIVNLYRFDSSHSIAPSEELRYG